MPRVVVTLCLCSRVHTCDPGTRYPHVLRLWRLRVVRLERRDCRLWRLGRAAGIGVSRFNFPALRQRRGGWLTDYRLWRRASLNRRHFADSLRGRGVVIVKQRHDVDFALRSASRGRGRGRGRLRLGWWRRRSGSGCGRCAILLVHRNRWLSLHACHSPVISRSHSGRLHRFTMHAAHGLWVAGLCIRLRNWRIGPSWLWLPPEGPRFHPRRHTAGRGLELRVCFGVMGRRLGLLFHSQRRSFYRPRGFSLNEFQPLPFPGVACSATLFCL
jgi:hypothetical protein